MKQVPIRLFVSLALLSAAVVSADDVYRYTAEPIHISAPGSEIDPALFTGGGGVEPSERLRAGYDAFSEGEYETALGRFKELTRDEPFYANALYGRALCQQSLGRVNDAVYEYNRLISYTDSLPAGDPERRFRKLALESLVRLLYENPPPEGTATKLQMILGPEDNKDALYLLGSLHREYAEYEEALEIFNLLYDQAPDVRENLRLLFARAEVTELQAPIVRDSDEQYRRAVELYERVVEVGERELTDEGDADIAYYVVRALGRLGLYHQRRAEQLKYGGASFLPTVEADNGLELLIDESELEETDRSYIYSRNRITRFLDNYSAVIALLYTYNVAVPRPDHRLDLQITISPDGAVMDLEVLESNLPPSFTDQLTSMVAAWRFPPGRKRVVAVYPIVFDGEGDR